MKGHFGWALNCVLTYDGVSFLRRTVSLRPAPQWGAADAEIKVPSRENTELERSPFKAWSRSVIAIHATFTARDFFLANFYPSGPFTCIFPKPLLIFPVLPVANTGSCVGPQNKIGHQLAN